MSQSGLVQVAEQRIEKAAPSLPPDRGSIAAHPDPCLYERPQQPRPHRALMVAAVARRDVALILRNVARIVLRQGAESERSPEPRLHRFDDATGQRLVGYGIGQSAHRKDLIGPKR